MLNCLDQRNPIARKDAGSFRSPTEAGDFLLDLPVPAQFFHDGIFLADGRIARLGFRQLFEKLGSNAHKKHR
jgi:hypothetical protein